MVLPSSPVYLRIWCASFKQKLRKEALGQNSLKGADNKQESNTKTTFNLAAFQLSTEPSRPTFTKLENEWICIVRNSIRNYFGRMNKSLTFWSMDLSRMVLTKYHIHINGNKLDLHKTSLWNTAPIGRISTVVLDTIVENLQIWVPYRVLVFYF